MTNGTEIWEVLRSHLPRGQWIQIDTLYAIVERNVPLDAEDLTLNRTKSFHPRWKTTVRTLLRVKKRAGEIRGRPGLDPH